jgi:hypothetical protein
MSQVWTPLPEHCLAPGVHEPEHAPFRHAIPAHDDGALHVPAAVHVSTPLPMHCVCAGAHTPVQPLPTHV